jgi:hypothetical protein
VVEFGGHPYHPRNNTPANVITVGSLITKRTCYQDEGRGYRQIYKGGCPYHARDRGKIILEQPRMFAEQSRKLTRWEEGLEILFQAIPSSFFSVC